MLRLRGEDRFALLAASLSMTISSSLSCLAEDGRSGTRGPFVVEASLLSASAHFQGDQIAGFRAAGFVVDRDLKVSPVTGKVVGADEQHRFVVGGAQLQGCVFRDDGQNG
jgi:hypothetical protein